MAISGKAEIEPPFWQIWPAMEALMTKSALMSAQGTKKY